MKKAWLQFVSWFNNKAKNFSMRLVKWTGKSSQYIHPKHLLKGDDQQWYLSAIKENDAVLDLGCHNGAHAIAAAQIANRVVGVDYNERNLEIAEKLTHAGKFQNIELKRGDLEKKLEEKNESFNVILALDILEHLNNRDQFMSETYRTLKKGGILFLSVPNRSTGWKKSLEQEGLFYYSDRDHKYEYEKNEIETILGKHGFDIISLSPTVLDTPWVGLIDIFGGISIPIYKRLSQWKRAEGLRRPNDATGFRIVARKPE